MHIARRAILTVALTGMYWTVGAQQVDIKARLLGMKPADFPARAIEFNVGAPVGGGMDITARLLAQKFQEYSGQTAIVNNRAGASGLIFHRWLTTQAPNDGHHIGVADNRIVTDSLLRAENKWSYRDVDHLAFINYEPVVWIAASDGRFRDLGKVLEAAKANGGSVRVGTVSGTFIDMLAEQVERAEKVEFIKVPFQGGAPSLQSLLGGHIDVSFGFVGEFRGNADKIKPIAVASRAPVETLPGVPTFDSVMKTDDVHWMIWRFVAAPKGIPAARRAWLAAVFIEVLKDPQLSEELAKRGGNRDPGLDSPGRVAAELDRMAASERKIYLQTGQLKP